MRKSKPWSQWYQVPDGYVGPYQYKLKDTSTWYHILFAEFGEPDPDRNHVHLKCRSINDDNILASVKVDGVRVINRGDLLKKINRLTGESFTLDDEQGE